MSNLFLLIVVLFSTVQCNVQKDVDDAQDELQSFLNDLGVEDSDINDQDVIEDHGNAGDYNTDHGNIEVDYSDAIKDDGNAGDDGIIDQGNIGEEDSDTIKDHKEEGKTGAFQQTKNPPNKRKSKTEKICPSVEKVLNSLNFGMIPDMPVSPAVSYMGVKCVTEYVCFNVCYMVNCRNVCKNRQQCHLPY